MKVNDEDLRNCVKNDYIWAKEFPIGHILKSNNGHKAIIEKHLVYSTKFKRVKSYFVHDISIVGNVWCGHFVSDRRQVYCLNKSKVMGVVTD